MSASLSCDQVVRRPCDEVVRRRGGFRPLLALLAGAATLSAGSAGAAEPLNLIPDDVSVVIRLQAPDTTIQDLSTFANEVQPGTGGLIQLQRGTLGAVISNPTLAGVDQSQDWYFAVDAAPQGEPDILLLIPATDAAEMEEAVGSAFEFVATDGWVAYSRSSDLMNRARACAEQSDQGFSGQLDSRHANLLNSGHAGILVSFTDLKTTYAEQLAAADDRLNEVIDSIAAQVASAGPGVDMEYVWSMYRDMGSAALQMVRDSETLTVSVGLQDQSLQIEELLSIQEGSATDVVFAGQPAGEVSNLQSLPENQSGYMAMHGNPQAMLGWVRKLMGQMIEDETARTRFLDALTIMSEAKSFDVATGGSILPDAETSLRYYAITEMDPADTMRHVVDAIGDEIEYDTAGIRQRLTLQRDAEQIDNQSVHHYLIEQELHPELDPLGIQKKINDKLYGSGGIRQRMVFHGDKTLQTMGGGTASMQTLLSAPTWSDEQLLAARQRFPERVNLIVLADLPEFVISMGRLMVESGALPLPVDGETLAELEVPRSYAGFSVSMEPGQLHARSIVPLGTFQGFAKIAAFAQQAVQAGPGAR